MQSILQMAQGQIYLIINKQNGKKYVGQTTRGMNKRWQEHIQQSIRLSSTPLHKAMREYGNHNFMIRELCECNVDELDEKEIYYIEKFNTLHGDGYNAKDGGDRKIYSEESKKKMSESASVKYRSPEQNAKMAESLSEVCKDKIKDGKKWGFMLMENRNTAGALKTKIMSVNVETGEEKVWDSMTEAAIAICGDKTRTGNIVRAMKKGQKAYGHLWKRLEQSKHRIPVYGIHKVTWQRTQVYDSMRDVVRTLGDGTGSSMTAIRKSVNNPRKYSWKGYYWFKA